MKCKKCPAFSKCTALYDSPACDVLRKTYGIDADPKIETNAARIRSMTDEELAKEFVVAGEFDNRVCFCCEYFKCLQNKDGYCIYKHGRCNMDARLEAYKKWLQQPAEEE